MTVLDTLITRFGFETDKSGLDKAEQGLTDFKGAAIKVAAAVGAILGGVYFLKVIAEAADETLKWADSNGVVIESLGELEFATQRQGGSVEGLRSSLSNINRAIGEVSRGVGRAKIAFEDYGLSIKNSNGTTKTADELLVDLNRKFVTLSKAQQFDLATKMGIDKGTIRLLQTAPDEIAKLRREASKLGVLTRQDAMAAADYMDGLTNIGQAISALKFEIGGFFFGPLANFFKTMADGIALIKDNIQFVNIFIGVLGVLVAWYKRAAIWAAIMWIASLGPIAAVVAGVALLAAGIALLVDDFIAFFNGQDSMIGDLVKKWPKLGKLIFLLRDIFVLLFAKTIEGFGVWLGWFNEIGLAIIKFFIAPIDEAKLSFESLSEIASRVFSSILGGMVNIAKGVKKFIEAPMSAASAAVGKLKSFLGIGSDEEESDPSDEDGQRGKPKTSFNRRGPNFAPFQTPAPVGVPSPVSPTMTRSNRMVSAPNQIRIARLSVDARGGDSKEIAQNVSSELGSQLKNMVEDVDSDIDR